MKLPVSFGSRLFYRVLLPGGIVSATIALLHKPSLTVDDKPLSASIMFLAMALAAGLIFLLLDRPIYMLLEGRRYWPAFLWRAGMRSERRRLARLHRTMRRNNRLRSTVHCSRKDRAQLDRRYYEAASQISDFPIDPVNCNPTVSWPTRLGNLIAAYEQYPNLKYGMDSIFYWPRLWLSIDNDLRAEIDGQQAIGDGAVYAAIGCWVSAAIVVADGIVGLWPGCLVGQFEDLPPAVWLAPCLILAGYLLLRISVFSYQQFGESFMSLFDLKGNPLVDRGVAGILSHDYGLNLDRQSPQEQNRAIWRYLKWHRIRRRGETKNEKAIKK